LLPAQESEQEWLSTQGLELHRCNTQFALAQQQQVRELELLQGLEPPLDLPIFVLVPYSVSFAGSPTLFLYLNWLLNHSRIFFYFIVTFMLTHLFDV
jgi:hypothetical protein